MLTPEQYSAALQEAKAAGYDSVTSYQEAQSKNSGNGGGLSGNKSPTSSSRGNRSYLKEEHDRKQETISRRNANSASERQRLLDNTAYGQMAKDAEYARKKAEEAEASKDNSAWKQKIKDDSQSLGKVQAMVDEYRKLVDKENDIASFAEKARINNGAEAAPFLTKAEEDLLEIQKNREALGSTLSLYGITANGSQVDADKFYEGHFAKEAEKAKLDEAANVDTIDLLIGNESSYSAKAGAVHAKASKDENRTYAYLKKQDELNGTNYAEIYKTYLEGVINQREGQARAEKLMTKDKGLGKTLGYAGQAVGSGLTSALNAVESSITGKQTADSASQYAAGILREDLAENGSFIGQVGFDAAQGIGAMAPGIAAGFITPALGAAVFGSTSAASAYQEKLNDGWNQNDAAAYGVLKGIAEGAFQYVAGGISKLAKDTNLAKVIAKAMPKIENAIAKAVANGLGRMLSEGGEELLQTYIEPAIASVVKDVPYDSPELEEAMYNALIGAVTSAGLGAGEFIADVRGSNTAEIANETDPAELLTGIPAEGSRGEKILKATTLDEVVATANSRSDMDKASAKVRSDEAMMAQLQQTVGRTLNGNNDVKTAIAELQLKASVEQKISAAVAEGTPQAIEKALMEIASNPRELNVLNKYYGNLPGTVEGNIEFAQQIARGETPAETATEQQPSESPIKAREVVEEQVTPAITQEAEQTPPERLNQQDDADDLPFVMNDDNIEADNRTGGYSDVYTYGNNQNQSIDSGRGEEGRSDGYNIQESQKPGSRVSKAAIKENQRSGARLIQESEYSEANKNTASIAKKLGAKDFGIFDTAKAKNFPGGKGRSTVDNVTGETYTSIAKGGDPGVASEGQVCAHECTHDAIVRARWNNALKFGDELASKNLAVKKARRWVEVRHGEMYAEEMYGKSFDDLTPEQYDNVEARVYEELFCDLVARINRAFDGEDIAGLAREVELTLVRDGVFPVGTFGEEYDQMIADSISLAQKEWETPGVYAGASEENKAETYTQTETSNAYSGKDVGQNNAAPKRPKGSVLATMFDSGDWSLTKQKISSFADAFSKQLEANGIPEGAFAEGFDVLNAIKNRNYGRSVNDFASLKRKYLSEYFFPELTNNLGMYGNSISHEYYEVHLGILSDYLNSNQTKLDAITFANPQQLETEEIGISAVPTQHKNADDDIFKKAEGWAKAKEAERVQEQNEPSAPQSAPASRHQPAGDTELTTLQMAEEAEAANDEARYQELRHADKVGMRGSSDYIQRQRDAERDAQRQREQEGLPKYNVAREYGEDAVKKFGELDGRLGKLVDEQRVFKDGEEKGTKVTRTVSRLTHGTDILKTARDVMSGKVSAAEFSTAYNRIKGTDAGYLYTEEIADAINEAAADVSSLNNTEFEQVTQEKKAKDITTAMQMLTHRAELAAEYKVVSSKLSAETKAKKSNVSKRALGIYFRSQATPDTMWKALAGFDREGNREAYSIADEALENNATEKRERSAGYSYFSRVTRHRDFEAFAKNKLMSGYEVSNSSGKSYELTAQEAVSLLHSIRSIKEETDNYVNGSPDRIVIERDGEQIALYGGETDLSLKELEKQIENHVTGVAKEYSEALDEMFGYYSPKFMEAIKNVTGVERSAVASGKYFPLFYAGNDGATFNISDALQSRFERLGFAKERVGPGSTLVIAPAAQIADNYVEQVSHYLGWASFSKKLEMLNANLDGAGSFLGTISNVYGQNTAQMFADYIKHVGGYKMSEGDSWFDDLLGRFAGAVITGRPSTAFSQLSSVYAAVGIIKPEAVRQAGIVFPVKQKHVNLDDGLLEDRARHGINDSTISEITRNADSKIKNIIEKIPGGKTYLNLVGKADAYATKQLYAACWCDVQMDYPDVYKSNRKLFDTLVEDKFMQAILFSQSDADRINNAALYRGDGTKGSIVRALSMFTGQPNKQLNLVMTALGEYNATKGQAKKEAANTLVNTVRGQAGAAISYSVLKTIASLALHKWYDFKDDEDELALEEIARSAASETVSTFAGMLWFGETVADRLMYRISDGKWGNNFEFQVNGISQLLDLGDNVFNLLGIVNGNKPSAKEIKDLALSVANVTGAPIQGAYDFVNALALWGVDAYNGIVNGEKPKGNYDIARYIDSKQKEKAKAEAAAAKAEAKAEEDAIDMLINAGKSSDDGIETMYGKTAVEIEELNDSIKAYKKDKTGEYDTTGDNSIVDIILGAGLTDDGVDALVTENTGKPYRDSYNAMRAEGLSPQEVVDTYLFIDSDKNGSLKQRELQDAYLKDNGMEDIIAAIWDTRDWKTPWEEKKGK